MDAVHTDRHGKLKRKIKDEKRRKYNLRVSVIHFYNTRDRGAGGGGGWGGGMCFPQYF